MKKILLIIAAMAILQTANSQEIKPRKLGSRPIEIGTIVVTNKIRLGESFTGIESMSQSASSALRESMGMELYLLKSGGDSFSGDIIGTEDSSVSVRIDDDNYVLLTPSVPLWR